MFEWLSEEERKDLKLRFDLDPNANVNSILDEYMKRKRKNRPMLTHDKMYELYHNSDLVQLWFQTPPCRFSQMGKCTMCNYWNGRKITGLMKTMLSELSLPEDCQTILINTCGSCLDPLEVPKEDLLLLLNWLKLCPAQKVIFETHWTTLNLKTLNLINAFGVCPVCNGLGEALSPDLNILLDYNLSLNEGAVKHKTWKVGSRYWNIIRAINYFDMDKKLRDFSEEEMDKLLYCKPFVYQNDEPGHVQSFSYEGIISRMIKRKNDSRGLSAADYDTQFFTSGLCPECHGTRLKSEVRNVKIGGKYTIGELVNMEISDLYDTLSELHGDVEDVLIPPILKSLKNLISVGLSYVTLNRSAHTLSGGEAQKVKLAKALGCSLNDMIYILDEPTAGLHPIDIIKMEKIIRGMVDAGNTVLVIEHNRDMILASDTVIDIGPDAGRNGGSIVFDGTVDEFKNNTESITAQCIQKTLKGFKTDVRQSKSYITLQDINRNNVQHLDVSIPKNIMVSITGVSGAGKSTLLDVLIERVPKAIVVDQSAVGTTVRGNAATYTKVFDDIRELYSEKTGFDASSFSFNSSGSCPNCNGLGYTVTDMHFMGDIRTPCDKCGGRRYTDIVLKQRVKGANIADVLDMTVSEAIEFFSDQPSIKKKLNMLQEVGLEYITLGQPLSTLSGGELQRLKLAGKITNKGNIYIFDEPTHGLHFKDTERLIAMMNRIVNYGNTLIVVEHNMEVVLQSDWIIDMGPSGGKNGGRIVYQGVPKGILSCNDSKTGQYLNRFLVSSP